MGWVAVAALLGPACKRREASETPRERTTLPRTIVLATIDTLRRDATGYAGRVPSPTPFLDSLASRGVVLDDAMAPVPLTGPSHWSMITGRWPWHDGVRQNASRPRSGHAPTLATLLARAGWHTAAFVSCAALNGKLGFDEGFDHFDGHFASVGKLGTTKMAMRRGDETVAAVLRWLSKRPQEERLFLWVHLYDPHWPYDSPGETFDGPHGDYLRSVAFADRQLAKLEEGLTANGRPANETLWIALSDHGEGLGEHDELTHGLLLHGAVMRIPFLIAGPRVTATKRGSLAATTDVFATVLGYAGVPAPASDGINLLTASEDGERAIPMESVAGAQWYGLAMTIGLRKADWLWEASPADRLWDLKRDPKELRNLANARPELVANLREERHRFGVPAVDASHAPDARTQALLRSLGYMGGDALPGKADVRVFCGEDQQLSTDATDALGRGQWNEARQLAQRFLARHPHSLALEQVAAKAAVGLGDFAAAESHYRKLVGAKPTDPVRRANLANTLSAQGRFQAAEREYRTALQGDSTDLTALLGLADLFDRTSRPAEAIKLWRRVVERYPTHAEAASARARLQEAEAFAAIQRGDAEAAVRGFRAIVEREPTAAPKRVNLANALLMAGRTAEAEAEYRKALKHQPGEFSALYGLASLLTSRGRTKEAIARWRELRDRYPEHPRATDVAARLRQLGAD